MARQTEIVSAPYVFTELEAIENSKKLAAAIVKKSSLESEEKTRKSAYKEKMDALEEDIENLTVKINSGHEVRDYLCDVVYDFKEKVKRYVRPEDNVVLETRQLSREDWQRRMDFEEEEKAAKIEQDSSEEVEGNSDDEENGDSEYAEVA